MELTGPGQSWGLASPASNEGCVALLTVYPAGNTFEWDSNPLMPSRKTLQNSVEDWKLQRR